MTNPAKAFNIYMNILAKEQEIHEKAIELYEERGGKYKYTMHDHSVVDNKELLKQCYKEAKNKGTT
jgi:hypothetical protein